jgi:hypothetical protein
MAWPAQSPIDSVGLTPGRAFRILPDRREEEVKLLLDSFEAPNSLPAAADEDPHSDGSSEPSEWVVPHAMKSIERLRRRKL